MKCICSAPYVYNPKCKVHNPKLSDEDILPCPFCGHHGMSQKDKGSRYYKIICVGCEAQGKPSILKSTAIQEWNTRIYREGKTVA